MAAFPGATDSDTVGDLMWAMQAHHIDTDYYDRFFGGGAYGPTHARCAHGDSASMTPRIGAVESAKATDRASNRTLALQRPDRWRRGTMRRLAKLTIAR